MKVTIAKTRNTGKGIFAVQDIKKGEYIFTFQGKIVRDRDYARKLKCTPTMEKKIGSVKWVLSIREGFFMVHPKSLIRVVESQR